MALFRAAPTPRAFAVPLAIFLTSLLLGSFYFSGLYGSDDIQYVAGALGIFIGGIADNMIVGAGRHTITFPLRLFIEIAGGNTQIAVAGFIVTSAIGALAIFFLATGLFGRRVGALAALLVAANPLYFIYAGAVLPDNLLSIFLCASILVFARWAFLSTDARRLPLFLVGVFAGLCYVTKEASLIFLLPVCAYSVYIGLHRNGLKGLGAIAMTGLLGFASIFVLDMLVSNAIFGHPFARLASAATQNIPDHAYSFMASQGTYPWERLGTVWRLMERTWPMAGIYWIGMVYLGFRSGSIRTFLLSPAGLIAVSALWIFSYLTWGSISYSRYIGVPIQERYFTPVALLLCVLLAKSLIDITARRPPSASWLLCITVSFILLHQTLTPADRAGNIYRAAEHRTVREIILSQARSNSDVPVYLDKYFSFRAGNYGYLPAQGLRPLDDLPRSLILIRNSSEKGSNATERAIIECESSGNATDITPQLSGLWGRSRKENIIREFGLGGSTSLRQSHVRAIRVDNLNGCRN